MVKSEGKKVIVCWIDSPRSLIITKISKPKVNETTKKITKKKQNEAKQRLYAKKLEKNR